MILSSTVIGWSTMWQTDGRTDARYTCCRALKLNRSAAVINVSLFVLAQTLNLNRLLQVCFS